MPNIWKENQDVTQHPNRNNFDLRFQNHLTLKPGVITPFMCKEVVPGDSFKIDTAFGLKFMPLVFPIQSRMRAHVHYFYVRNKNLWKNWENFISGLEQHEHPYIDQPASFFKTGSLADYLDVPTTIVGEHERFAIVTSETNGFVVSTTGTSVIVDNGIGRIRATRESLSIDSNCLYSYGFFSDRPDAIGHSWSDLIDIPNSPLVTYFFDTPLRRLGDDAGASFSFEFTIPELTASAGVYPCNMLVWYGNRNVEYSANNFHNSQERFESLRLGAAISGSLDLANFDGSFMAYTPDTAREIPTAVNAFIDAGYSVYISLVPSNLPGVQGAQWPTVPHAMIDKDHEFAFTGRFKYSYVSDSVEGDGVETPFSSDADSGARIKINALPFRAYESVYNAYYRNTQNQPFYVEDPESGQMVEAYNRYNSTLEDGSDTTPYHLFRRNYELDYLTSAMPSPQFGTAPLVGMTALGNITIEDENGITTAHAEVDNDGTISKVVLTSPAASVEHARTAMNIASSGMSINDFRGANSLQLFLEQTLRSGYRYVDFIRGHFGKQPEYRELDMPEFIGGTSEQVTVNLVSNMTAGDTPLGQFAGTANCFGTNKHSVTHYCDDYGWILGVVTIVPDPAYSQILPKHYLKNSQLDYYFPEFSQLGLQPITYREVCPVQAYQEFLNSEGALRLTDTFGYQRPNYDLVGYTDQVHGLFRTDLRNFLVNRIFATRPELGTDFLEIKAEEVNDIFADMDPQADNIIGQIVVDIKAKRPVPRVNIPSLGR